MSINPPDLPSLTVNRSFIKEFITAQQPCCALGLVEVQNQQRAFVALRPETLMPSYVMNKGFAFGHILIAPKLLPRFEPCPSLFMSLYKKQISYSQDTIVRLYRI
jgi:hypothetical protein